MNNLYKKWIISKAKKEGVNFQEMLNEIIKLGIYSYKMIEHEKSLEKGDING